MIGVLAFLSAAAIGSAAYAWQQLKTNEAFLYATLKTATGIVDAAVTQADKYGVPPTATLALITHAEGLFDNMAMLGKPTPELRYQKAWMLIQFARNYQALGDTTKWQERAVAAQQLLQTLSDGDPKNTADIRDLAIAESTLGDALDAKGDLDGALQNYGISLSRVLEPPMPIRTMGAARRRCRGREGRHHTAPARQARRRFEVVSAERRIRRNPGARRFERL